MVDSRPGETVANPAGKPHNVPTGRLGAPAFRSRPEKENNNCLTMIR